MAEHLSSEVNASLANIGIFQGLIQIMKSGFKLKREMAADICRALYDGSDLRKDKFVEVEGVTTLVHVMNMDRDDPNFMHNALLRLYVLIQVRSTQDDQEGYSLLRVQKLNSAGVITAIGALDLSQVTSP